jgi:ADP-L-glycero-D-manno-heptose 6-epimerase
LQYSSSASVYGQLKTFDEEGPVDPRSPYAWSKYLFDRYVNRQKKLREFNEIIVQGFRYFNVYGPHEDHKGDQASPYHKFEQQAKNTGTIKLFQNSDQYYRDFVPVQTVVDVHKKFFNINESNIWNVGTGKAKSFQEVGEEISQKYNATIEYIPMPESMKTQYQTYTKANIDKLRKHFDL